MMSKELLFSVTKDDCRWDYFRCPGKGGQKVNKTSSGVRCTHPPSGAVGKSCDERQQHQNKKIAFKRMVETKEFETWRRLEAARLSGELDEMKKRVEQEMRNIKVEVREDGVWVEVDPKAELRDNDPIE